MSSHNIRAKVIRNEEITKDICRLTIDAPDIACNAYPGQFVMIKAAEKSSPLLRRPFSIHQATSNDRIQILFKIIGKGTEFLASRQQGDTVDLVGPLGKSFALPDTLSDICLIGGGMGIAPLFFLAKHLCRAPEKYTNIKVLLGAVKSAELTVIIRDFESIGIKPVIATDDGSLGHHGFVTELIGEELSKDVSWSLFTCGPHPMMHGVSIIAEKYSWPCQVSLETLMACGVSACLGCAVKSREGSEKPYLHVCKDGPVFDAGAISWA